MVFEVERHADGGLGDLCRSVLGELGEWFGIPESNADYIEQAEEHPGVVVRAGDQAIGLTTLVHHGPEAAEVYLMAVRRASHRTGAGTAMLAEVERWLAEQGVGFLQVKTLSGSRPDENYARTRAFYLAYGFVVLEEHPTLWDPENPALQLIKTVEARH